MFKTIQRIRQERAIRARLRSLRIWITQEPSREDQESLYTDYLITLEIWTRSGDRIMDQRIYPAISELSARRAMIREYPYALWINVLGVSEI